MKVVTQNYIGTTEEWKAANPKLYNAVWGFEITKDKKLLIKIGNGADTWNNLKYFDIENVHGLQEKLQEVFAAIGAEAAARSQGDSNTLNGAKGYADDKVAAEAQARQQGDMKLQEQLNILMPLNGDLNDLLNAVTVEAAARLQGDANALTDAKNYADEQIAAEAQARLQSEDAFERAIEAEAEARSQGDANALTNAKNYADEQIAAEASARLQSEDAFERAIEAETEARQLGDSNTLNAAKSYADGQVAAEAQARQQADNNLQEQINILTDLDGDVGNLVKTVADEKDDRVQGDADTLTAAKSYADNKVAAEATARSQGDSATLVSAEIYADNKVAAEATARSQGDTNTLNAAKSYADNRVVTKQDRFIATGATNLLTAPAAAGGQPGAKAVADFVQKSEVVNNLTSTSANTPLSAAQGKALNDTKQNKLNRTVSSNDNATGTVTDTGYTLNVPIPVTTGAPAASSTQTAAGTRSLRAQIKILIDNIAHLFANMLPKAGGTMTGTLYVPDKMNALAYPAADNLPTETQVCSVATEAQVLATLRLHSFNRADPPLGAYMLAFAKQQLSTASIGQLHALRRYEGTESDYRYYLPTEASNASASAYPNLVIPAVVPGAYVIHGVEWHGTTKVCLVRRVF